MDDGGGLGTYEGERSQFLRGEKRTIGANDEEKICRMCTTDI